MTERLRLLTATLLVALLAAWFWHATSPTRGTEQETGGGEIETAAGAVRAWGRFASTGDIRSVAGWFATDGPQYRQLLAEAEAIVPGGIYDFALSDAEMVGPGLVRGSVTVSGGGSRLRNYRWDIDLVRQGGHWKVWTVRTSPDDPET